jgi:alkanesulfonate monooxygenase SsuD/methylene tetrahydromethanopterin reductase-like flavin-dependent oxidoreductase (luciferase family)
LVVSPQHRTWERNVELWKLGESLGFESIWLNDHFHSLGDSIDNDAFEASTALAALALTVSKPKIGVLTYGNTHRIPTILAKEMVTIDYMSGGRVILGIGAGWNEPEHAAYAIPFPGAGDWVGMLDEALEIIKLLEQNDRTTYQGKYYTLIDTPFVPKPVNGHIPILVGGTKPRMLRVTGRHADIWDSSMEPDEYKAALETIRGHARDAGRDPESIIGSSRAWRPGMTEQDFIDRTRAYHAAGVRQFLVSVANSPEGFETLTTIAEKLIPEMRAELSR